MNKLRPLYRWWQGWGVIGYFHWFWAPLARFMQRAEKYCWAAYSRSLAPHNTLHLAWKGKLGRFHPITKTAAAGYYMEVREK